ncbi:MAG: hypothetical protein JNL19_00750 [Burkholderiales bacterium]|nr:hypothetical protein [Burkholderiales bacterium]
MDNVRIDLSAVADIDPEQIGRRAGIAPRRPPAMGSETVLEGALRAYAATGATGAGIVRDALAFSESPTTSVAFVGSIRRAPVRPHRDWTIAVGPSVSAAAGAGAGFSGGLYFWNKTPSGEIGFFGSASFVAMTNIGASVVGQGTYYFGSAPDCLAGTSLVVGIDVGPPGRIITGGGYLVFSPNPVQLIGISFALGVGVSALPVNLNVQLSRTWIRPI